MHAILSIAGSDSYGGAGIQADLKTCEAFNCYGTTAITVLTAQNSLGVTDIFPVTPAFLEAQLSAITADITLSAIKIGMLFNAELIETVSRFLTHLPGSIPVILDPVAVSASGAKLLADEAIEALRRLFSLATVLTPNRRELALFTGLSADVNDRKLIEQVGLRLADESNCTVVVKNLIEENRSTDLLFERESIRSFSTSLLESQHTHGTGCSFSTALACLLADDTEMLEAVSNAKRYVHYGIQHAPGFGQGNGPILHHQKR